MPNYDYECTKYGHKFEVFQKMNDKLLTKCPECGAKIKRLIGAGSGIIFKGSGFYATDYKKSIKGVPAQNAGACPKMKEGGCSGCNYG